MSLTDQAKRIMFNAGMRVASHDPDTDEGQQTINDARANAECAVADLNGIESEWDDIALCLGVWFDDGFQYGLKC